MQPRALHCILAATHAASLLVGFMLYQGTGSFSGNDPGRNHNSSPTAAAVPALTPEQLLKGLTPALSLKETLLARREKNLAAGRQAILDLKVPADLRAALDAEVASWYPGAAEDNHRFSPRLSALLYEWLRTDPEACGKWLTASESNRSAGETHLEAATMELLKQPGGIEALMKTDVPTKGNYSLAGWLSRDPDPSLILQFQSHLEPKEWNQLCRFLGASWPESRRQEMINFAIAQNQPSLLITAASMGTERHWLMDVLNSPDTPVSFREALVSVSNGFPGPVLGDPSVPLDQRLQFLSGLNPEVAYGLIASRSIRLSIYSGGPDWSGMVRSGLATPQQALDGFSQAMPELAAAAPEVMREKVFSILLARDAPQAGALLAELPAEQRADIILRSSTVDNEWSRPSLDSFAQIMELLPPDDPSLWDRRYSAWSHELENRINQGSDENAAAWLEALPPGPNREIAFAVSAGKFKDSNPELAARLLNQVTDPRLTKPVSD